jgi:hypothetical protein
MLPLRVVGPSQLATFDSVRARGSSGSSRSLQEGDTRPDLGFLIGQRRPDRAPCTQSRESRKLGRSDVDDIEGKCEDVDLGWFVRQVDQGES